MKGYRPKHFKLCELVPKALYEKYKNKHEYLWRLLSPNVLEAADIIREFYNRPCTVNDAYIGGTYDQSGLRTKKVGSAELSAHLFGLALDIKVAGVSPSTIHKDIREGKLPKRFYQLINQVEHVDKTPTWVHIASVNVITKEIQWI